MAVSKVSALVSSSWLRGQLSSNRRLKLLDASWTPLVSGYEKYISKHIPGAQFLDLNHCVNPKPTLANDIPQPDCFADYVRSLGVGQDSHVVVCDRGNLLPSARTWWIFRLFGHSSVSVLDGGLKKWEADGNTVDYGQAQSLSEGDFVVTQRQELMKTFEGMMTTVRAGSELIVDARQPVDFRGETTEPTSPTVNVLKGKNQPIPKSMHQGHIPGAVNLLEDLLIDQETGCLLPQEEIMKVFGQVGVDLSRPLTTMCYNGNAAAVLALASHICGKHDVSVYNGSWTEWGQRATADLVVRPGSGATGG